jgi:hypothetical protein
MLDGGALRGALLGCHRHGLMSSQGAATMTPGWPLSCIASTAEGQLTPHRENERSGIVRTSLRVISRCEHPLSALCWIPNRCVCVCVCGEDLMEVGVPLRCDGQAIVVI